MGKVIESPVKHYPGTVTIASPLNFGQWMAWTAARQDVTLEASRGKDEEAGESEPITYGDMGFVDAYAVATIPGVLACVEEWHLDNFPTEVTAETFPATPRGATGLLIVWLAREIDAVAFDDGESPNE